MSHSVCFLTGGLVSPVKLRPAKAALAVAGGRADSGYYPIFMNSGVGA